MSKEAYRKKAEARIEEQQAKLDQLRAKAKGAGADARLEAEKQIGELEEKLRKAKRKLAEVAAAAEDVWEDVAKGLDDAWEDVSSSAKRLFSRFSYADSRLASARPGREEPFVHPWVVAQLRVKGGGQDVALAHQHRLAVHPRQHLHVRAQLAQPRRANEHAAQPGEGGVRIGVCGCGEGVHLGAVGVAGGAAVEDGEGFDGMVLHLARQQDRAGAGAQHRVAGGDEAAQRLVELQARQPLGDGRALATGQDQRIEPVQVLLTQYGR
jgi:hypothetical protein